MKGSSEASLGIGCGVGLQNSAYGDLQHRAMQGSSQASLGIGCGVGLEPKLLCRESACGKLGFSENRAFLIIP